MNLVLFVAHAVLRLALPLTHLHDGRRVDPQRRVEEAVVQHLLEEQVRVGGGASDQVLGELQEGVEQLRRQVGPGGPAQQVRHHQKAAAGDHLLLDGRRRLYQLADEAHQLGAANKKILCGIELELDRIRFFKKPDIRLLG